MGLFYVASYPIKSVGGTVTLFSDVVVKDHFSLFGPDASGTPISGQACQ